jgi:hypothetical protein
VLAIVMTLSISRAAAAQVRGVYPTGMSAINAGVTPGSGLTCSNLSYRVNALGFASNVVLPARQFSLGLKYFKEFSNRSTFQGYTLQITSAVTF